MKFKKIFTSVFSVFILMISVILNINVTATAETFDLNNDGKINVFDAILMKRNLLRMDTESPYNISDLVHIENEIITRNNLIGTPISAVNFNKVSGSDNEFITYVFENYSLMSDKYDVNRAEISLCFSNNTEEIILIFPKKYTDSKFVAKIASVPLSTDPKIIYSVECDTDGIYGITAIG